MVGLLLAALLASGIGLAARAGGWMQWLERGPSMRASRYAARRGPT